MYPETTTTSTPFPSSLSTAAGPRYIRSLKTSTQAAYTLLAIPQGVQTSDHCSTLTPNQGGVQGVTTGDAAGSADLIAECWSR